MKIRIDIDVSNDDVARALACMDLASYRRVNLRTVRHYLKDYLKSNAEDSLYLMDRDFRDPAYKFYDYFCEYKERLKGIK